MKLKFIFEMVDMGDEVIAVPVGPQAEQLQGIIRLNQSGQEILELLKTETTEEKIVDTLAAKYEDERTILAGYVHTLIETLRKDGLIEA